MVTKREVYEQLEKEFNDALPQVAHDCDVSISEAIADKFDKRYLGFRDKLQEEFVLLGEQKDDE